MVAIPTVAIAVDGGPVIINQTDYDPEKHQLWNPLESVVCPELAAATPVYELADQLRSQHTRAELYQMASDLKVKGRSGMDEEGLALAVATAQIEATG